MVAVLHPCAVAAAAAVVALKSAEGEAAPWVVASLLKGTLGA